MSKRAAFWSRTVGLIGLTALQFTVGIAVASATTLIMPNRQALVGTAIVVWGNTTLANGTADSIDCGNGTVTPGPTVTDQSYISGTCTYAAAGNFNAVITVGAETATAVIDVRDPATLSAFDLRAVKINMAIEDGLRSLYFNQFNRAARFATNIASATPMTSWRNATGTDNFGLSFSSLAVLAIQNHGHAVNGPATDIFQPVVQNGLNWLFDNAMQQDMTPCSEGGAAPPLNPCIGAFATPNIGLTAYHPGGFDYSGYATPILTAAIAAAAAAAPTRTVAAGLGSANAGFVAGKSYGEILQRFANAVSWGQSDGAQLFGWYYNLETANASDGSTLGWAMLGLENAAAAGATVPAEVRARLATTLTVQLNAVLGSLGYQGASGSSNPAKTGIGLQALSMSGAAGGDPRVALALGYLTRNWSVTVDPIDFTCTAGTPTVTNKGCGYAMFNIFKGLRLYGINTLPGIGRPAGPGPIPADDWYADYVDNLLANQHNANNPTGGDWSVSQAPAMGWSCCESDMTGITALAELILAPTAFVQPNTVTLAPLTATNAVGTNHTVTATALTAAGGPAPGVTVTFTITAGPNAGPATCTETGGNTNTTDANGQARCTYADTKGAGTDSIQANIGAILSNIVQKIWSGNAPGNITDIPTLSEWGLIIMAGLLALVGLGALRLRKGRVD